jgi:proteic killer suppression protein
MIRTWKHKGLKRFFVSGDTSGINSEHAQRLKVILQLLNVAKSFQQMDLPGMRFHKLKGELKEYYAVTVRANWRVIFQFEDEDVILVNYLDYH